MLPLPWLFIPIEHSALAWFETGSTMWPTVASTSNGRCLLTAELTDVQHHAQKNVFLQFQVLASNAMEANLKKENL